MKARKTTSATRRSNGRPGNAGFTLLELLVVILIMTMAGTLLSVGISSIRWANLSTQSRRMKAMVRYLYEKAVLTNHVYSLTIDLDKGRYWGEVQNTSDPCHKYLMANEEQKKEADNSPKYNELSKQKALPGDTDNEEEGPEVRNKGFGHSKDLLLKQTKLPEGLRFDGVLCEHFDGLEDSGIVRIHFFPNGYVEHAFIYLAKGDDVYTIETLPLRGTAEVNKEKLGEDEFAKAR